VPKRCLRAWRPRSQPAKSRSLSAVIGRLKHPSRWQESQILSNCSRSDRAAAARQRVGGGCRSPARWRFCRSPHLRRHLVGADSATNCLSHPGANPRRRPTVSARSAAGWRGNVCESPAQRLLGEQPAPRLAARWASVWDRRRCAGVGAGVTLHQPERAAASRAIGVRWLFSGLNSTSLGHDHSCFFGPAVCAQNGLTRTFPAGSRRSSKHETRLAAYCYRLLLTAYCATRRLLALFLFQQLAIRSMREA